MSATFGTLIMLVKKNQIINIILLLLFKAFLEVLYVKFVYEFFSYAGYGLNINITKLFESYFLIILLYLMLPEDDDVPSKIVLKLLFLFMVVPFCSFYALTDKERSYFYFFVISFVLTMVVRTIIPAARIKKLQYGSIAMYAFVTFVSLIVLSVLIKENGLPTFKAFNLAAVYEVRGEAERGSQLINYMIGWLACAINTFLIGLACYQKRYFRLLIPLGVQLILYAYLAQKSFLFTPLAIVCLFIAVRSKNLSRSILIVLVLSLSILYAFRGEDIVKFPASLLVRRVFFVPANVTYNYYDYFSKNEFVYMSNSRITLGLIDTPYKESGVAIANLMGLTYAENINTYMNTGYLGNAYMQFGFAGMLSFSFILGLVLVFVDSCAKNIDVGLALSAVIIPLQKLSNTALFSSFLSNGLLIGMMMLWLYEERSSILAFKYWLSRHILYNPHPEKSDTYSEQAHRFSGIA